jgi:hypothetical protein
MVKPESYASAAHCYLCAHQVDLAGFRYTGHIFNIRHFAELVDSGKLATIFEYRFP